MGANSLLSSPLSTLMSSLSPEQKPNYNNAFNVNLLSLRGITLPSLSFQNTNGFSFSPSLSSGFSFSGLKSAKEFDPWFNQFNAWASWQNDELKKAEAELQALRKSQSPDPLRSAEGKSELLNLQASSSWLANPDDIGMMPGYVTAQPTGQNTLNLSLPNFGVSSPLFNNNTLASLLNNSTTAQTLNATAQTLSTTAQTLDATGNEPAGTSEIVSNPQAFQGLTKITDVPEVKPADTNLSEKLVASGQNMVNTISSSLFANKAAKAAGAKQSGFQKMGGWLTIGAAADLLGSFMPEKTEYSGTKGDLAKTLDTTYDTIADTMMAIPGWGCVCAGTRVIDNKGRFVNIEDLKLEDGIVGWHDGCINKERIVAFIEPHEKECIEIELLSGTKLKCSIDHPILCSKGKSKEIRVEGRRKNIKVYEFIRADLINIGDNVGIANEIDIWGTSIMPNAYLIGMLIGDGTYGKDHGARLYSADPDTWNYIEKNQLGGRINYDDSRYNKEFRCYRIFNGAAQLRDLGIYELTRLEKTLPKDIYKYTKESVSLLLAGLFDTDGCVFFNKDKKEYKISLAQANRLLLEEVSELLLKLGVHTSLQTVKEKKSVIRGRPVNTKLSYNLIIKDKWSIINFYNNIKLNISYKRLNLEDLYNYVITLNTKDNRYLVGVKADKVVKITKIGLLIIYNLQADNDHTYLANGIVTHNTIAGGIMKGAAFLGKGVNALGGGTDGMCVCAGTKVFKANGEIVNIEDLKQEDGIIGWSERTKEIKPLIISNIIEPRLKKCVEITLKSGLVLRCSIDHPILSDASSEAQIRLWKFRRADELKVGDFVGLANNIDYWGSNEEKSAYLVGTLIADLVGQNKTLPKNIGSFTRDSVCKLIAGLFDIAGNISIDKQNYSITLLQSSKSLLEEIRAQLQKLGIFSTIRTREVTELEERVINSNLILEINDIASVITFCKLIPLHISYKKDNLALVYEILKDKIPQEHNSGAKQCKIVSITYIGVQTVYNLQADHDHTYLANGIITHNTTTDAILGSSFLSLTPIGLINGFGGQKADTITKDDLAFETVGSSYGGTMYAVDDALTKSGKKYGLFSSRQREKANREIQEARRQLDIMSDVADEATNRFAIRNSTAAIHGNRRAYLLQGGYNQADVRVGKSGMSLELIQKSKLIVKALKGSIVPTVIELIKPELIPLHKEGGIVPTVIELVKPEEINEFRDGGLINTPTVVELVKPELVDDTNRFEEGGSINTVAEDGEQIKNRTLEELIEYAKKERPRFILRMSEPFKYVKIGDSFGTHQLGYAESDGKFIIFPNIQEDDKGNLKRYSDWKEALNNALKNHNILIVNSEDEAKLFTESEENPDGTFTGYKSGWPEFFKLKPTKYLQGGSLDPISEKETTEIYLTEPELIESVLEFKLGGSVNVIPEGALHARKHNMDMEGITKKGIPVVSEGKDGEIELQAEIERSEIIYRKSVTEELERLCKIYYDNNTSLKEKDRVAIEAGKLLVEETLHNTIDNTGELL